MPDYKVYPFQFGVLREEQKILLMPFFKGEPGYTPPGGGEDSYYPHIQGPASDDWLVTHNLHKRPSVTVVDSAGDEVEGQVTYISDMQLRIRFSAPFSGTAYCN